MKKVLSLAKLLGAALSLAGASAPAQAVETVDQGKAWSPAARRDFYYRDQGSRLIPLRWMTALKQANGAPFLEDGLSRYGYLADDALSGLPVGFVVAKEGDREIVGMTCAACHTRQIEAQGKSYRIDGGPAMADLFGFWADLDAAVERVLKEDAAFKSFAAAVLPPPVAATDEQALREEVKAWFARFHAITEHGLPKDKPWGPGRADAVSMIFNRLAGLDVGPAPSHILVENIKAADAPVRYPFLWNAPLQDMTQWPGFARNGDDILGLARNAGEVIGVFAVFAPKRDPLFPFIVDYLDQSSINFPGLLQLESDIKRIGAPKWPWKIDAKLAAQGKEIFDRPAKDGGCGPGCHEIKPGAERLLNRDTWRTPEQDVGTDSREYMVLARTATTGALEGAFIPLITQAPLKAEGEKIVNMLAVSVIGSILQFPFERAKELRPAILDALRDGRLPVKPQDLGSPAAMLQQSLKDAFDLQKARPADGELCAGGACKYESRVLEGIWATAPYLHNGSVPSLAELLKPPAQRAAEFKLGPAYDTDTVGLAANQMKFDYTLKTTGCEDRNSGASRCGHDFGTTLPENEKKALLEYLKTL